jgi:hypothetical protein
LLQALTKPKSQYMAVCDFRKILNVNALDSDVSKYINEHIKMRQAETVRPSHVQTLTDRPLSFDSRERHIRNHLPSGISVLLDRTSQ